MAAEHLTPLCDTQIQTQLARIVASPLFSNAPRLTRFLTYVVEHSLAGRADCLKGYTIGLEVFDKPDDFDPQTDTIVRVQARALRQKLDAYYAQEGAQDPVQITIAKGGYQPEFSAACEKRHQGRADRCPAPDKPAIAVLPFEHIGPKTDFEFLSQGLTEGTIASLSRFRDLAVFSRASMEQVHHAHLTPLEIHARLQADFVLEGSFCIRTDSIEARITLIDAAHDAVIMTDRIDMPKEGGDIYDIQDEIVSRIAARIAVEYGPIGEYARTAERSGPAIKWETYAAISTYFQAGLELDQAGRDEVGARLTRAVAHEPVSAEAHAALAMIEIENYRALTQTQGDAAMLLAATDHATRAVQLDPHSAMAYQALALAYFHQRRFVDFRACAARAVTLNPGHSDMLAMFAICHVARAEWEEGIPMLERAIALNPLHPGWYTIPKAMYLALTQDARTAIAQMQLAPVPDFYGFHFTFLWLHVENGDMAAAHVEKGRLLNVAPEAGVLIRRHFDIWCLKEEIVARMIAAFRKVGLHIPP